MKNCPDGTHCQNEYLIEELEHKLDLCEHVAKTMSELHDQRVGEIYELTAELARLQEKLHDEMSQLEIATELGNKRWVALNEIYENGEKHNANWCKRKAQEGLGIK